MYSAVPLPGLCTKREKGTSAPDTMCTAAQQAKLLHRINRRSLFLTVQASIWCRCTTPNQSVGAVPEDIVSKPPLRIQMSALPAKLESGIVWGPDQRACTLGNALNGKKGHRHLIQCVPSRSRYTCIRCRCPASVNLCNFYGHSGNSFRLQGMSVYFRRSFPENGRTVPLG